MPWTSLPRTTGRLPLIARLGGLAVLFLPCALLLTAALRSHGSPNPILAGGVAAEAFLAMGLFRQVGLSRIAVNTSVLPLYLIGVSVLWVCNPDFSDWFLHVAVGVMLFIPLSLYGIQEWLVAGGYTRRRAKSLMNRLVERTDWPEDLAACKALPEVRALRAALRDDAEPALELLLHPKPQVRIAALAALEFRPSWQPGQAEMVLRAAKFATEPLVRAAAIMALANADNPGLLLAVTSFLRDSSPDVRRATAEALLWDVDRRWSEIRDGIRRALADSRCSRDGPLPCGGTFPEQAVADLKMWAGESGPIAGRAVLTLMSHYRKVLNDAPSEGFVDRLTRDVADGRVPAPLRLELAHLLQEYDCLKPSTLEPLLQPIQPSALRLLASGALLGQGPHPRSIQTLRELARGPNREMALAAAQIIQLSLRIDMGLPIDGTVPHPQSKQAAEVARRVLAWAREETPLPIETPAPPHRKRRRPLPDRPSEFD